MIWSIKQGELLRGRISIKGNIPTQGYLKILISSHLLSAGHAAGTGLSATVFLFNGRIQSWIFFVVVLFLSQSRKQNQRISSFCPKATIPPVIHVCRPSSESFKNYPPNCLTISCSTFNGCLFYQPAAIVDHIAHSLRRACFILRVIYRYLG